MPLKTVVIGSSSDFTSIVVQRLINASTEIAALMLLGEERTQTGPRQNIPLARPGAVEIVAAANRIKTLEIESVADDGARVWLEALEPDVLLIACCGEILPAPWLAIPHYGCLNLHPSALPAYRGPVPLFWQLRAGEPQMGVTLHRATERVDAGPILAQRFIDAPPGGGASEVLATMLAVGAEMAVDTLAQLDPVGGLDEREQDESAASYFGWPKQEDFCLSTRWTAERAFRFMRGTREWGQPYTVETGDNPIVIERALDFDPSGRLDPSMKASGREVSVQFAQGTLRGIRLLVSGSRQSRDP